MYHTLADVVLIVHAAFVAFVVLGGLLVLRWPRLAWVHVPAAIWGMLIEYAGWVCPLTPLENSLRRAAGDATYSEGFIERYITAALYPQGLTRGMQIVLGTLVLAINAAIYWRLFTRTRR